MSLMESYSPDHYYRVLHDLYNIQQNITGDTYHFFYSLIEKRDEQSRFGKPMIWIGIYIAIASVFCILPMLADLLHGFKNKKLWFPCKYFTLNAASLTVIAIAVKLPMDLNNPMPGITDQMSKFGSLAFMCTMMANLLPSLASMDGKELLTNIISLGILVITMIVNVCIQLQTGVLDVYYLPFLVIFDVIMLFLMLMMYVTSALTISKSKQILESQYQASHEKALNELEVQQSGRLIEKLRQYVNNHWIMAGTGNPQFMVACFATSSAAGAICVIMTVFHFPSEMFNNSDIWDDCESDYKRSTSLIFIMQYTGVLVGTIAPISRCFASLNLKFSLKWIYSHIMVFKVECHYTQKLYDWKRSSIPLSFKTRRCKIVIHNLKALILTFCIGLQMAIVIACKLVSLIPILLVICVMYCWKCLKAMFIALRFLFCVLYCWGRLKAMFSALAFVSEKEPEQLQQKKDLRQYVLQLQDDVELADRTLKAMLNSVNHLIQNAEKQKPVNLMKLLEGSSGYEGVGMYDMHQVPPLLLDEYSDSWSLTVVNLTTIAISLPNIQKNIVHKLLSGVSEGLKYVKHVEEGLNSTDNYVNLQKASEMLWLEVEVYYTWLGNNLQKVATQVHSMEQILQWFTDIAKNLITEVENTNIEVANDNLICRTVSANSMYCITQAILRSYHDNNDIDINEVTEHDLFMQLSSMISDILAACLTNLPQVITLKCHTKAIEKREASVQAAAHLLGQTMEIINSLQDRGLPNLNPAELPFINKWRYYFNRIP
uniref:uncharacterized protein LOC122588598 n=1 Tax=Erigeron canadensis TaxID=72917 RepID=UPI001CB9B667|nr:uncharacterized protein LOC122588598 [Erigeron canadensis]